MEKVIGVVGDDIVNDFCFVFLSKYKLKIWVKHSVFVYTTIDSKIYVCVICLFGYILWTMEERI